MTTETVADGMIQMSPSASGQAASPSAHGKLPDGDHDGPAGRWPHGHAQGSAVATKSPINGTLEVPIAEFFGEPRKGAAPARRLRKPVSYDEQIIAPASRPFTRLTAGFVLRCDPQPPAGVEYVPYHRRSVSSSRIHCCVFGPRLVPVRLAESAGRAAEGFGGRPCGKFHRSLYQRSGGHLSRSPL